MAAKNALKLINLPSMKVICWKPTKRYSSAKSQNFADVCIMVVVVVAGEGGGVGGWVVSSCPHHTNYCKILRVCGATSSFLLGSITFKLGKLPYLRSSFQQCWWIFAYYYLSKIDKKMLRKSVLRFSRYVHTIPDSFSCLSCRHEKLSV